MILELFAGIGGAAEADPRVCAAIDHDEAAHLVYTSNFAHPARRRNLASISTDELASFGADTWWMSPPCQPFTVRGRARDVDDPRCAALLHLVDALDRVRPRAVAMENVPGFAGSRAHARLLASLRACGYHVAERLICPSEWGVPNRRRRFYLVARTDRAPILHLEAIAAPPLPHHLDAPDSVDPELYVSPETIARYGRNLPVVDARDSAAVALCFTSAYGRSPVYAGSYLRDEHGLRLFSPDEIVRLLGFRNGFRWPDALARKKRFKLAGNSLSVGVVRQVLRAANE